MKILRPLLLLPFAALALVPRTALCQQTRVTAGVKAWTATWDIHIERIEGTDQTDYSSAILVGPYASVRVDAWTFTGSFGTTATTFDASAHNPGYLSVGFNANRVMSRRDINLFVGYSIVPELSLFVMYKNLYYRQKDAITYINGVHQPIYDQKFTANGFGGGMQVAAMFSGGSGFYTFTSIGLAENNFKNETSGEKASELLYFLDGGLGFRFSPTTLAATLGIRVEHGKETKTILGPTAALFYTF